MNQPTTHTPGPWTFFRESSCDRGDSYGVKAPAPHHWVVPTLNIRPEDARLIAAAPDLLALLIRYRKETPLGHQPHMIAHEVDAAIAKATGDAV